MPINLGLGTLEHAVMTELWAAGTPLSVRDIHCALTTDRVLAYTTVMTVLNRLAGKGLVTQMRDSRAFRYTPTCSNGEMVAARMVAALAEVRETVGRTAALARFVECVGPADAAALRAALT